MRLPVAATAALVIAGITGGNMGSRALTVEIPFYGRDIDLRRLTRPQHRLLMKLSCSTAPLSTVISCSIWLGASTIPPIAWFSAARGLTTWLPTSPAAQIW